MRRVTEDPDDLSVRLERWAAAGLISASEAAGIARWERLNQPQAGVPDAPLTADRADFPARRRSVVIESLAYLGGAVILVGLVLATIGYWPGLSRWARVAIPLATTAVLLLAGAMAPPASGAAASRLRGTLWLVSSATLAVLLAVVTDVPSLAGPDAFLIVAGGTVIGSLALWLMHRAMPQQVATFVAVEALAVAIANEMPHAGGTPEGASMVCVAVAWGAAAWFRLLPAGRWESASRTHRSRGRPRDAQCRVGVALAAVGAAVGGVVLAAQQDLPWLAAVPIVLVVSSAIATADLLVLGIGAAGTLVVLPMVVHSYVESVLSMALVLLASGAVLVAIAVGVARRRRTASIGVRPVSDRGSRRPTGGAAPSGDEEPRSPEADSGPKTHRQGPNGPTVRGRNGVQ